MILSILIPTIRRHTRLYNALRSELNSQILPYAGTIEVLTDNHETDNIGAKRNRLLERATGKYLCFFDSDDTPGSNYIATLMAAAKLNPDCASLKGMYYVDGKSSGVFEHSIKYHEWKTVDPFTNAGVKYERTPNHLNMMRASIAKQFKFPDKSFGEDHDWSKLVYHSGLLKSEVYIPEVIYHYYFVTNKS